MHGKGTFSWPDGFLGFDDANVWSYTWSCVRSTKPTLFLHRNLRIETEVNMKQSSARDCYRAKKTRTGGRSKRRSTRNNYNNWCPHLNTTRTWRLKVNDTFNINEHTTTCFGAEIPSSEAKLHWRVPKRVLLNLCMLPNWRIETGPLRTPEPHETTMTLLNFSAGTGRTWNMAKGTSSGQTNESGRAQSKGFWNVTIFWSKKSTSSHKSMCNNKLELNSQQICEVCWGVVEGQAERATWFRGLAPRYWKMAQFVLRIGRYTEANGVSGECEWVNGQRVRWVQKDSSPPAGWDLL